jgi:hypothetical protein
MALFAGPQHSGIKRSWLDGRSRYLSKRAEQLQTALFWSGDGGKQERQLSHLVAIAWFRGVKGLERLIAIKA